MKLGVLGGTFDPVHNAHLAVARAALRHLALDRLLFIPTGNQKYRRPAMASGEHRVAMLRLALDDPRYAIDERELDPGFSGYTVDTLHALKTANPDAKLVLLMGADQFARLDTWHEAQKVRSLAELAVVARPGSKPPPRAIPFAESDLSSSAIRERLAAGEAIDDLVPAPVANYISRHGLYQ